jgi:molecular chaperone GrpE
MSGSTEDPPRIEPRLVDAEDAGPAETKPVEPRSLEAIAELAAELDKARADVAQLKDQALRALAEAENTRRRAQRDREDFARYASAPLAKDILSVADNLARALAAVPAEAMARDEALKNLVDGIAATERQLLAAFERQSIKRIDPEGERFDSNRHQAMFEVPGSGQPAGTVVQFLQPGYVLHDRLLRPALVGVAKNEAAGGTGNGESGNSSEGAAS